MCTCLSRVLHSSLAVLRCFSTAAAGLPEASDHVQRQILQAGLHYLKGDTEKLKENVTHRAGTADVDKLVSLQKEYYQLLYRTDNLRHERNLNTKRFGTVRTKEERDQVAHKGAELKNAIADLEAQKHEKEEKMIPELANIPNDTHPDVPLGGYENARVVYTHGSTPEFKFPVKEHVEIGESLGLFDFSSAAQVSGHSFYYLKGAAALLELALIQYAMQKAIAKGYHPVITPDIIKTDVVEGCGFHPRGSSTQVYSVSSHHGNFSLSGTAEIPLAGMYMDKVVPLEQFPIRMVAFGRCFRAEAGGYGHMVRGLYRVHQFSKVELFGLTADESGEESGQLLEEIVEIQKEIFSELGLHYRLLDMPTEELGTPAYRKYDLEVWMPGRKEYGEVTSASNCTDFQSRRLKITYPNPSKKQRDDPGRKYAHTVNGTACAVPRVIIALLEHYQQEVGSSTVVVLPAKLVENRAANWAKDGSVVLPQVLRTFLAPEHWHIKPSTAPN